MEKLRCTECQDVMPMESHNYGTIYLPCCIRCYSEAQTNDGFLVTKILLLLMIISFSGYGQVLEVANSYMGKRVSTGICWQLVQKVLKESGTTVSLSDTVKDVRPGDIYRTKGVYDSIVPVVDKNGDAYADWFYGTGSHIAIVSQVLGDSIYEIIEQNGEGRRDKVRKRIVDIKIKDNQFTLGQYFLRPREGEYNQGTKRFITRSIIMTH